MPRAIADFLKAQVKSKLPAASIFAGAGGEVWNKDAWNYPIKDVVKAAGLPLAASAHTLPNSVITDPIRARLPILTVAQPSGVRIAMIEKHYGHLVRDDAEEALASIAFQFVPGKLELANLPVSGFPRILAIMAEHWIPSAEAIEFVAQRYDASKRYADFDVALAVAEEALLKRLSSGALRARASKGHMNWGDPFLMENETDFENDCLPASFWSTLSRSDHRDRNLDWVLGDFSYTFGQNDYCASGDAFDVHFDARGIPGSFGSVEADSAATKDQRSAGRPAKFDWPKTVLAIFGLIYRGDLKPENQAEIERALIAHLDDKNGGPSQSTVRPYAKLIWEEYNKV